MILVSAVLRGTAALTFDKPTVASYATPLQYTIYTCTYIGLLFCSVKRVDPL
jgi:hypothetical protein